VGPFEVRLEKVGALPPAGSPETSAESFFVGNISVGRPPQQLRVLFDTGSGAVLLPHKACNSPACVAHRRYSPWKSDTAVDVNADGTHVMPGGERLAKGRVKRTVVTVEFTQADLGEGAARGVLVRDDVCLGPAASAGKACAGLAVLAATSLADRPFGLMPHDGILGLSLEGLSTGALGSFFERLMDASPGLLPHFAISLGAADGSIVFGGHDRDRISAPLRWFPVSHPAMGFWQVQILAVRVGNVTVDACRGGCHGVIDTGSSSIGAQADKLGMLLPRLRAAAPAPAGGCLGPDLLFDLGGMSLVLTAEDYTGASCKPKIGSIHLDGPEFAGFYALGTTLLHNYYTAFDWAHARVGFAPLRAQQSAMEIVI